MRGMRSTLALLVVLVGLGAYIYFVASKQTDTPAQERVFPSLSADAIEEMTIRNEAGDVTSLKKVDGKWQMTAPVAARASDLDASGITSALSGLEVARVVEEKPADLKEYGLDKPTVEVAFTAKAPNPSGKIFVGGHTATAGNLYARKDGETKVILISEFNLTTFNKSTFDLRDKAIVTFDKEKADGVDVVLAKGGFELAKSPEWRMLQPIAARADASAADGLVTAVESLQMKAVVTTAPTADELKRFGLETPAATVNVHLGTERVSVLVGGPAGDDTVYAKSSAKPDVYTIQKAAADDLMKVADDYRRKDLFDMRAFTATRIEVARAGKTTVFEKVKGTGDTAADTWKRVSPTAGETDKEKFPAFVAALADIRAMTFVDPKTKTGLDAPAVTITVKFDEGKREEKVLLSKVGTTAYASRPDDPGIASIDTTKFDDTLTSIDEFTK